MSEQTEVIKLNLEVSKFLIDIQKAKENIKSLDQAIKALTGEKGAAGKRNELIIEKGKAEANLKSLQAELKNTQKEMSKTGESGSKNWALIATGIGAAILAFNKIKSVVSGWMTIAATELRLEKQLNAAIKSTGGSAGVSSKELMKYAEAMAKKTGIDKAQIIASEAMLLTFTKIGKDVFPLATEATLNMSKVFGTDAKQSAIQLGKALQDPIMGATALRRVGIMLSDTQKKQIKDFMDLGDIASAQKVILNELNTEFGGVATATASGLGKFNVAMNEVKASLGTAFVNGMKPFIDGIIKLSEIGLGDELEKIEKYGKVEYLSGKQNKSKIEQQEYAIAIEQIKKQYPEYLQFIDAEKTTHEDIIKALAKQGDLTKSKIIENMYAEEKVELTRQQAEAEVELITINSELARAQKYQSDFRNKQTERDAAWFVEDSKIKAYIIELTNKQENENEKLTESTEKLSDVNDKYKLIMDKINEEHAEAIRLEKIRQEELKKKAEAEAKAAKAAEEQAEIDKKAADAERKYAEEALKNYELKLKLSELYSTGKLREIELTNQEIETVKKLADEFDNLKIKVPDLDVSFAELFDGMIAGGSYATEEFKKQLLQKVQDYNEAAQLIAGAGTAATNYELQEIDNKHKAESELYAKQLETNQISKEEYEKKLLILDNKVKKDKRKILEEQKKWDTLSAISNTAVGVTKAYSTLPFPLNWIQGAAVLAAGYYQVKTIQAQKFGKGTVFKGASHSQGGIDIGNNQEVEGDEMLLTRGVYRNKSARKIASGINELFGGAELDKSPVSYSSTRIMSGGGITVSGSSTTRIEKLLEAVNANIANLDLSVAVNNSSSGLGFDKIETEVTRRQEKYKRSGGNLADR